MRIKGQTIKMPEWQKPARPECLRSLGTHAYEAQSDRQVWSEEGYRAMDDAFVQAMHDAGHGPQVRQW